MTRANDAGFIVLDALLGATVLALAGTVILTIVVSGETRRQAELDRSVALVAMQSLIAQFAVLDDSARGRLGRSDELYRYTITEGAAIGVTALSEWSIEAQPVHAGEALALSFLARR